jgi:hypothetical protein
MKSLKHQLRPRRRLAAAMLLAMTLAVAGLSTAAPAFADEGQRVLVTRVGGEDGYTLRFYVSGDGKYLKDIKVTGDYREISMSREGMHFNPYFGYSPVYFPKHFWEMAGPKLSKYFGGDEDLKIINYHGRPLVVGEGFTAFLGGKQLRLVTEK